MDVGEEEQRGIVVERVGELVARHHLSAAPGTQPPAPSAICRSVGKLPASLTRCGAWDRGAGRDDRLEQVGRGGVADDYLVRLRTDQRGDQTAEALRRVDPAFVPAADQPFAPLPLHRVGERGVTARGRTPANCRRGRSRPPAARRRRGSGRADRRRRGRGLVAGHAVSFARAARMSARWRPRRCRGDERDMPGVGMVWRSTESPAACACAT